MPGWPVEDKGEKLPKQIKQVLRLHSASSTFVLGGFAGDFSLFE
jgi:hypothetical protein